MKDSIKEIKQLLKTRKVVFGTEQVIKKLTQDKIEKFFISSNCKDETKKDLQHYAKIGKVEEIYLKSSNKEIGIMCKKPFSISVVGVLK